MSRLFGTDGVRGVVNADLTPELVFGLGRSGASVLARSGLEGDILVGRDTRRSGKGLEAALTAGLTSVGARVIRLGVMTTPGIAFLVRKLGAAAGVMISASHNPAEYNGIKFFSREGFKLPDQLEDEITEALQRQDELPRPTGDAFGVIEDREDLGSIYIDYLTSLLQGDVSGLHVVLDCANGAPGMAAPAVFERLGCRTDVLGNSPDGLNINDQVGALYPSHLAAAVRERGADLGFAFDGDADRVIAVDNLGRIVDGDAMMAIAGLHLLRKGQLPGNTVAATVMSNIGLERTLQQAGGKLLRTKVGDRYVLEAMLQHGLALGGEQSGHIIFLKKNSTGDGILTAIQILQIVLETGRSLAELADQMVRYPQVLHNVTLPDTVDREQLLASREVEAAVRWIEQTLGADGRILIRPSGTEPLIRIMIEGSDEQQMESMARELGEKIADLAPRYMKH